MNAFMEAVLTVAREEPSALARARLQRQLTPEEAARRAGLTPDEVEWLEEGRLYRFRSSERATVALLLYTTSLGIDRREARRLAGLPVGPATSNPRGRLAVAAGIAATALADRTRRRRPAPAGRRRRAELRDRSRSPPALADLRRRPQRRRRHHLHPPGRRPRRLPRVPDQAREPRRPVRLPGDVGLLPARRRGHRTPARRPARRHGSTATRRKEPAPAGRDRRARLGP